MPIRNVVIIGAIVLLVIIAVVVFATRKKGGADDEAQPADTDAWLECNVDLIPRVTHCT